MKIYAIVGAGGFGRELMPVATEMVSAINQNDKAKVVFVVEGAVEEKNINGYEVISDDDFFELNNEEKFFNIAIGNSEARERIAKKFIDLGITPFSIMSHNSLIMDNNDIDLGSVFCPFTTVTSNAKIGKFFQGNIYSYVAHDCVIGDYVTFAPGAKCNGNVFIDDHAYIGTGAIIKQGKSGAPLRIGKKAIVGMGAVVTKDVPDGITVIGNPAKPLTKKS
jgi:sugar O-acyltransferase (sialic acid O-acetyltransferase NeuD family)